MSTSTRVGFNHDVRYRPDELTCRQWDVFQFLLREWDARRPAPTVREIMAHFGLKSPNAAMVHLKALEKKRWIGRPNPGCSRSIAILKRPGQPAPDDVMGRAAELFQADAGMALQRLSAPTLALIAAELGITQEAAPTVVPREQPPPEPESPHPRDQVDTLTRSAEYLAGLVDGMLKTLPLLPLAAPSPPQLQPQSSPTPPPKTPPPQPPWTQLAPWRARSDAEMPNPEVTRRAARKPALPLGVLGRLRDGSRKSFDPIGDVVTLEPGSDEDRPPSYWLDCSLSPLSGESFELLVEKVDALAGPLRGVAAYEIRAETGEPFAFDGHIMRRNKGSRWSTAVDCHFRLTGPPR